MTQTWTKISLEDAKKHPLYGRSSGALILAGYLVLILSGYFILAAALSSPGHSAKPGGIVVLLFVLIIYRLFKKKPCKSLICGCAVFVLIATALLLLLNFVSTPKDQYFEDILLDASLTYFLFSILVILPTVIFAHTSRRFRVTYENEVRSDDPFLVTPKADRETADSSTKASSSGSPKYAANGLRTVRCNKCNFLNRVSNYSFKRVPICGNPNCRAPLQEPAWIRLVRFCYVNPLLLMALGIALAIVGFLFLDRYLPAYGLIWNVMRGTVAGLEYRYLLVLAVSIFLLGGLLWARK